MTWEDKIYAIPQTVDMQMFYYRKSLLDKAGVAAADDLRRADRRRQQGRHDQRHGRVLRRQRRRRRRAGHMLIWSAGFEQINDDKDGIGFDDAAVTRRCHVPRQPYELRRAARERLGGLVRRRAVRQRETAMQWTGLWVLPDVQTAFGDDFGVVPFPGIGASGPAVGAFRCLRCDRARQGQRPDAAKDFVKWLWVDQEDYQVDFSNSYGTHIPAKPALVPKADKIASGAGAEAAGFVDELGHAPDKLWTPATAQACTAAVTNVVFKKADPKTEIAKVAAKAKSGDQAGQQLSRAQSTPVSTLAARPAAAGTATSGSGSSSVPSCSGC